MKINTINRKYFSLGELFEYSTSNDDYLSSYNHGDVEYVSSSAENNGVSSMIDAIPSQKGNTLTIARNGSVGTTFYHKNSYCASSDDIRILTPKFNMNSYTGLFLSTIINKESFRFSYGRKLTKDKVLNMRIKLPTDEFGNPDREFMENYIKSLHYKPITTKNKSGNHEFNTNKWNEFSLDSIFSLKGGFYNKKPEHSIVGTIPFLASTESNNGVTEYYSLEDIKIRDKIGNQDNTLNKKLYDGNCIAVTVNGSVCNAFYQNNQFTCSHDITALYLKGYELNQYIAMFLCSIIMKEKYRWSYGRKPHDVKKFGKSIIKLPVDSSGNPDRKFMENYIKNLPYGDRI